MHNAANCEDATNAQIKNVILYFSSIYLYMFVYVFVYVPGMASSSLGRSASRLCQKYQPQSLASPKRRVSRKTCKQARNEGLSGHEVKFRTQINQNRVPLPK